MSTTTRPVKSVSTPEPAAAARELTPLGAKLLAVLRIAFGLIFLWAFVDKLFGLGFATKPESAWIRGGDPTLGYLSNSPSGPFASFYNGLAGQAWVTWLFMISLLAIGIALLLGIALRITAVAGGLLYVMMWSVALPPTTNPVLDDHLLGAISLAVFAATSAGLTWGLSKQWRSIPIVAKNHWLW
jgi:thiosulfate dehydrogenase [quinone] large subunit